MLQTTSIPHTWRELLPYAIAIVFASFMSGGLLLGLVAAVSLWLTRKQPAAAVHLSQVQAELAEVQIKETEVHVKKTYGEIFDEMHARLGILVAELGTAELRIKLLETQVARARAAGFLDRDEKGGHGPNPAA